MTDGLRKGLTSYGDAGFSLFLRKAFIKAMGYSDDALDRPIVGITNTYSDYNPCHGNVPQILEAVKRGVMLSGAMPMVFPTISIAETFSQPTSRNVRTLMPMETGERTPARPRDAGGARSAEASGRVAAAMAKAKGPKPSEFLTASSFRNAQVVLQAIGGSTNGLIHLTAIAHRTKHKIDLDAFDKLGREVPVLVDLKPSGEHYMEHFHHAGGVPKLMAQLGDLIDLDAKTITGATLREIVAGAEEVPGQDAIRPRNNPIKPEGAMAVLHGNLAPRGAVIKHSAASPKLLQHTGRAVVFESVEDMTLRVDDPDLDVNADDVLVLRNAGPKGAPGMPEAGYLPIPKKLARGGVKDMVRISDARMSGTAFGTIVLHITPESAVGGPLALVKNGDMIRLDVSKRNIDILVDAAELEKRRAALLPVATPA